jgi:hypothetical protein
MPQREPSRHSLDVAEELTLSCDNFVEHGKHSSMASYVIDMHKRGDAVLWSQCIVGKFVRSIVVIGELISCRNHCA